MDIEVGVMPQKMLECTKNLAVIKIMSISYPFLKHVDESFDEILICEKARNRQIFLTILWNIQFISRQGLAFQGNNNEGNFEQLMKLNTEVDPRLTCWMEKKQEKYLHHDTQNKIIRLMAFIILRDIAKKSTIRYSTR